MGERSISVEQEPNRDLLKPVSQWPVNKPIRVLSLVEATFVTGPAKSLMEFAATSSVPVFNLPCVENSVVTFQREGAGAEFVTRARDGGLDVSLVHERFAFDPRVIPQLRSLIAEKKPDIIQSMNFKSHFLVRLLGLGNSRKWVAYHHGYTWTNFKNSAYNQLDRWSLRKADAVVTVCIPFARELQNFGVKADKLTVQHNSIRPFVPSGEERIKELKSKLGLKPDDFTLICIGRLSREKGHADLIEAMAKVRAAAKRTVRLVIVGDGPERVALQSRVVALKLDQSVTFAGFQSDVAPYYQVADMAVLPSHSEGSPYALLEAMAAGVPALATSVGGVPEIVQDNETGFLVPPECPERLGSRILELVEDQALRQKVSRAAKARVDEYRPEVYRTNLTQLYLRVLAEPLHR